MHKFLIHPHDMQGLTPAQQTEFVNKLQQRGFDVKLASTRTKQDAIGNYAHFAPFVDAVRNTLAEYEYPDETIPVASLDGWELVWPRWDWERMSLDYQTSMIIGQYWIAESNKRANEIEKWLTEHLKTPMVKTAVLHVWEHIPAFWTHQLKARGVKFMEGELAGKRAEAGGIPYLWEVEKPDITVDPSKIKSVAEACECILHEIIHTVFQHHIILACALDDERPFVRDAIEHATHKITNQLLPPILEQLDG